MKINSLFVGLGVFSSLSLSGMVAPNVYATDAINMVPIQQVSRSTVINKSCADVWDVVSDFDGIANWYSGFSASSLKSGPINQVGAIRVLTRASNGKTFEEKMILLDPLGYTLAYSHVKNGPVKETVNQVKLVDLNSRQQCLATWGSTFRLKPAQAKDAEKIKGFFVKAFEAVLTDLKNKAEG